MREACARAGIVPAVGLMFCATPTARCWARRAVPMAVIARQLGHADTRMTEKALRASRAQLCGGHDPGGISEADDRSAGRRAD